MTCYVSLPATRSDFCWWIRFCSNLDWEIIVVDDASPDGTQEVARQLATVYGEDKVVCSISVMGYNLKLLIHGLIGPETPFWKTGPRVCFIATILNLEELSDAVNRACRTAYIHGLNFCSGDFVIIMDADFSHHVCCSWISVFVR